MPPVYYVVPVFSEMVLLVICVVLLALCLIALILYGVTAHHPAIKRWLPRTATPDIEVTGEWRLCIVKMEKICHKCVATDGASFSAADSTIWEKSKYPWTLHFVGDVSAACAIAEVESTLV